jgi:hypothetical protein
MADSVLDTIDRKKQDISSYEKNASSFSSDENVMDDGMFKTVVDTIVYAHPLYGDMYSNARNKLMDIIDRPLNAAQGAAAEGIEGAKKGIAGEVDYSYLDAMSPEFKSQNPKTASSLAFAGDLVLDPLNLVGAGLFTKGTQALKKMGLGAEQMKGGILSSASNYIKNWYGPTDIVPFTDKELIQKERVIKGKDWTAKKIDELKEKGSFLVDKFKLDKVRAKLPDTQTAEEADNFYRKVKGVTEWGTKAIDPVIQILFSPQARALYKEKGINVGSQQNVRRELKQMDEADKALEALEARAINISDPKELEKIAAERKRLTRVYSRSKEKAVAQVGFNSHITVQADRTGNIDDSIKAFKETSSLTGYVPFNKEWFKQAIENTQSTLTFGSGRNKKVENLRITDKSLDFAVDTIKNTWKKVGLKENAKLMVKVANSTAGNHISDVVSKNPTQQVAKKVFIDFKTNNQAPTIDSLYDKLSNQAKNSKVNVVGKTDEGVWVQTSKVGGAVIEGGINILTLVTPSGRTVSFMSDQHNFLENLPAVGKLLGKSLPVDEISISQPIFGDLLETNALKNLPNAPEFNKVAREGRRTRGKSSTTGTSPIEERTMTNKQLEDFAYAQASPEVLKAQQMKMGGAGLLTQGLVNQFNED